MVEVFAGVEVILDKTSIELYINNFIGDNVRSSVPIYSVRLKAFDLLVLKNDFINIHSLSLFPNG